MMASMSSSLMSACGFSDWTESAMSGAVAINGDVHLEVREGARIV